MARLPGGVLPDDSILGQAPDLRSGRTIASSADGAGAAIAKGVSAFGEGISDVGKGLAIQQRSDDAFELSKAKAAATTGKIGLDSEFEHDTDHATAETRYREGLEKVYGSAEGQIANPKLRERFRVLMSDDYARGVAGIKRKVYTQTADSEIAAAQTDLKTWQETGLSSGDEGERSRLVEIGQQRIEGLKLKGYITAQTATQMGQKWVEGYGEKWLSTRDPADQVPVLRQTLNRGDVAERIIGIESGGKATAKNPNSSATGLGQFISSTWLDLIKSERPDLAQGRDDKTLLALRNDPTLSRQMVKALADKNTAFLQSRGLPTDPGAVYLAHFLGPQGAAAVLGADPSRPVSELVSPEAVKANPTILAGKTAGSVMQWATQKMGGEGRSGTPADFIPYARRVQLLRQAESADLQNKTAAAAGRGEQIERQMIDARAGSAELPTRGEIEADPVLDEPRRNTLLRQYDQAADGIRQAEAAMRRFQDPAGAAYNPFSKDDKADAQTAFERLGGNEAALSTVVERTRILPESVATSMRGALASSDPKQVAGTMQMASNLLTKNGNIFDTVAGGGDLEKSTIAFRQYVEHFGMSADQAAQRLIQAQTPEYKAKVKVLLKEEDINALIKGKLSTADLTKAFNEGLPIVGRPVLETNPAARQIAMNDFAELFKDRYAETGDADVAKAQAVAQMKKVWGVSRLNGTWSGTLMRFPPERASAFAGIENADEVIASQAAAEIKTLTGTDVSRDKVMLAPLSGGQTSQPYINGQPAPYLLSWYDKDGKLQMLPRGKAFTADPAPARAAQTERRRTELAKARDVYTLQREVEPDAAKLPFGISETLR